MSGDHRLGGFKPLAFRPGQSEAETVAVGGHDEFAAGELNLRGDRIVAHPIGVNPGERDFGQISAGFGGCDPGFSFEHGTIPPCNEWFSSRRGTQLHQWGGASGSADQSGKTISTWGSRSGS